MIIRFDKKFNKKFKKLSVKIKEKFYDRLGVFKNNKFEKILNNNSLHGEYKGCRSVNITGNYRVVYKTIETKEEAVYLFVAIGTHSELYE